MKKFRLAIVSPNREAVKYQLVPTFLQDSLPLFEEVGMQDILTAELSLDTGNPDKPLWALVVDGNYSDRYASHRGDMHLIFVYPTATPMGWDEQQQHIKAMVPLNLAPADIIMQLPVESPNGKYELQAYSFVTRELDNVDFRAWWTGYSAEDLRAMDKTPDMNPSNTIH